MGSEVGTLDVRPRRPHALLLLLPVLLLVAWVAASSTARLLDARRHDEQIARVQREGLLGAGFQDDGSD